MKSTLLSILLFLSAAASVWAQSPHLFNYQGIARSTAGAPLVSQPIGMRFTVHDGSTSGTTLYQETQSTTTNAFGLYVVSIGSGTVVSGTFSSIGWGSGNKYLQVELDPTGGTSYADAGTSQLISVPYSEYANTATNATNATTATTATSATSITGTVPMGGDVTGTNAASNVVKIQGRSVSSAAPTANQVLEWNTGTSTWTPTTLPAGGTGTVTSVAAGTGLSASPSPITTTGTISLANTTVAAGTYGNATNVPQIVVDAQGRITSATNTPISAGGSGTVTTINTSSPLTGGPISTTGTIGLGTTGTAGAYGDATHFTTFTTDAYGRVSAVTVNPVPSSLTSTGTANYLSKFTSPTAISNSALYQLGSKLGLGTTTPNATLGIASSTDSFLLQLNETGPPNPSGIEKILYAGAIDAPRAGLYSRTIRTAIDSYGVGVFALGSEMGVYGYSASSSNNECVGAQGDAYNDGSYSIGVYGFASNYAGTPGAAYGVYGFASNGTVNYAGYFDGDIYATSASSGIKSFKIDHPADPANKYLYHSSVESNDMMNLYNGNVVTDGNGDATVTLPSYFTLLNKDYKYQLTCIGQFAQAIVSEKVAGNQFKIKTDKPNVEVSWQVAGVRQDPVANAYRIKDEVEKPVSEKGTYLAPELYGYGHEKSPAGKSRSGARNSIPPGVLLSQPATGNAGH